VGEYTVKPNCIQTPLTFLTLSQFIRYSLGNGDIMSRIQWIFDWFCSGFALTHELC